MGQTISSSLPELPTMSTISSIPYLSSLTTTESTSSLRNQQDIPASVQQQVQSPPPPMVPLTGIIKASTYAKLDSTSTTQQLYSGNFSCPMYIESGTVATTWICPDAASLLESWGGSTQIVVGDVFGVLVINNSGSDQTFNPGTDGSGGPVVFLGTNTTNTLWFKVTACDGYPSPYVPAGHFSYVMF